MFLYPALAWADDEFRHALASAYQTHPRLLAARRQYEAAVEELAKAMAGFYPNLSASYQRGEQWTRFGSFDTNQSLDVKSLNMEQPIFSGGQSYYAVKAARRTIAAEQAQLQDMESEILLAAATAYMDVIQAHSLLELSQRNHALLQQARQATSERFSLGEVTRTDLEQSEARYHQAAAQYQRAQGQLLDAYAAYKEACGLDAFGNLQVPRTLPALPATLEQAVEAARAEHFPLQAARARKEAAAYAVDTSIGRLLPQVALVGSMQREEGGTNAIFAGGRSYESEIIALRVNIPLYQTGAEYAQVRQNKAREAQQRDTVRDLERSVEQRVSRLWQQWQTARHNLLADKAASAAAERALAGVKQEQAMGERTVIEVLNAEQERFQFQVNQVQDARNAVVARMQLLAALGQFTAHHMALPINFYDMEAAEDKAAFHPIGF